MGNLASSETWIQFLNQKGSFHPSGKNSFVKWCYIISALCATLQVCLCFSLTNCLPSKTVFISLQPVFHDCICTSGHLHCKNDSWRVRREAKTLCDLKACRSMPVWKWQKVCYCKPEKLKYEYTEMMGICLDWVWFLQGSILAEEGPTV